MKKIITFVLAVIMVFTACRQRQSGVFEPSRDYINQIIAGNKFPITVTELNKFIDTEADTATYILQSKSTEEFESPFGSMNFEFKGDFCQRLFMNVLWHNKGLAQSKEVIKLGCDIYGLDDRSVVKELNEYFHSGENVEFDKALGSFEIEFIHNSSLVTATFMSMDENVEDYTEDDIMLIAFSIWDQDAHNERIAEHQQVIRKSIEDNPLLYSKEAIDYPPRPDGETITGLMADMGIPYTAKLIDSSITEWGNSTSLYHIFVNKENNLRLFVDRYVSGKEVSLVQNFMVDEMDSWVQTEYALKTAAAVMGIEDTEGFAELAESFSKSENLTDYFEFAGYYCEINYYKYVYPDEDKVYLASVFIYEPDVFKGHLNMMKNTANGTALGDEYNMIYNKYFG